MAAELGEALGAALGVLGADLQERLQGGVQHLAEGAEAGDEGLGQGLDVGVGNSEGEEELQELIVLKGLGAAFQKTAPEAAAVAVVMGLVSRGLGLGAHMLGNHFRPLIFFVNLPMSNLTQKGAGKYFSLPFRWFFSAPLPTVVVTAFYVHLTFSESQAGSLCSRLL